MMTKPKLMKNALLAFMLMTLLSFFSCTNSDVLSTKEMEDLLVDLHLSDGMMLQNPQFKTKEAKLDLYSSVYALHHTTKEQFDSSMVYYTEHLTDLGEIYDNVIKRIELKEQAVKDGQYSLTKRPLDKSAYARLLQDDIELLPYVDNELWTVRRPIVLTSEDLDQRQDYTINVDTLLNRKAELRFRVESDSLLKASCALKMVYDSADNELFNFDLPLDSAQLVKFQWTVQDSPDKIVFSITTEKSGEQAYLNLSDCRLYDISSEAHSIYLFR